MTGSEIEEASKAVQGIAAWGTETAKAAREAGGFLARVFGDSWEEANGILEDRLRFHRAMKRFDFLERFAAKRAQMGLTGSVKPVSLKFGIPLLEAASLEPDDGIREMMATLLANATDETRNSEPRAAFVDMLKTMEPLDARVLVAAYRAPKLDPEDSPFRTILTGGFPDGFYVSHDGAPPNPPQPTSEVMDSLWNLVRLGCLSPGGGWNGVAMVNIVTVTTLGAALVEATVPAGEREPFVPGSAPQT